MATATLTVVHALPGRVRLRLPPHAGDDGLANTIAAVDGVIACRWSPRTRGLLVHYDPAVTDVATLIEGVADHAGVHPPVAATTAAASGDGATPRIGVLVPALFARANRRVAQATRGAIDLGVGIPLALVAWAALELARGRAAPLAWSTALWYAHGLFRDYHAADPLARSDGAPPHTHV